MLKLYSAQICPFAQRTRALLVHLEVPFELLEIDLSDRDPEFLALSPTGRVPMLVDGDFTLYESQVINEYLADVHGWQEAFPADAQLRARHRVAMKQWDEIVVDAFYDSMRAGGSIDTDRRDRIGRELDALATTVAASGEQPESLLAFHCAPHWARMDWLRRVTSLAELVDDRPPLHAWLHSTVQAEAIRDTLPDREVTITRYERRYAASIP